MATALQDLRDTNYVLPQDQAESIRLERQYRMFKILQGREESVLPNSLDDYHFSAILDAAAGTCVWILDFARMQQHRERLSPYSDSSLDLYACDITSAKFPSKEVAESVSLKLFEQDVTNPFPAIMQERFDLINMKLLVFALTEDGWKKALRNLRETLKPGGFLLLSESDGFFRTPEEVQSTETQNLSTEKRPWTFYLNRLFVENARINGHITDLASRLADLVRSAEYEIFTQTTTTFPMGVLCKTHPGLLGQQVAAAEELSAEQFLFVLDTMTRLGLRQGYLEDENGAVSTEQDRLLMVERYAYLFSLSGVFFTCTEIVARKNLR